MARGGIPLEKTLVTQVVMRGARGKEAGSIREEVAEDGRIMMTAALITVGQPADAETAGAEVEAHLGGVAVRVVASLRVTTIFVSGLPDDSREDEVRADLEVAGNIVKVVLMRRGSEVNAFIRFETVREANRAVEKILDGKLRVCGQSRVKAEMARRNTN